MEPKLRGDGARRDVVCAAEGGEEVVERVLLVRLMTVNCALHLYLSP